MIRHHLGRLLTEPQRRQWAALIAASADEAGLPEDPEFRSAFVAYLEWGSSSPCSTRSRASTWILSDPCQPGGGASPAGHSGPNSEGAAGRGGGSPRGEFPFDAPSASVACALKIVVAGVSKGSWPDRSRQSNELGPSRARGNNLQRTIRGVPRNGCRPCSRDKMSPEIRSDRSGDVEFSPPSSTRG